jgi:hypothetical protein
MYRFPGDDDTTTTTTTTTKMNMKQRTRYIMVVMTGNPLIKDQRYEVYSQSHSNPSTAPRVFQYYVVLS